MLPELLQHHANMNTETIMCFIFSRSFLIISMSNKNYRPTQDTFLISILCHHFGRNELIKDMCSKLIAFLKRLKRF